MRPLGSILWRAAACCALGAAITLAIVWWSAWRGSWADSHMRVALRNRSAYGDYNGDSVWNVNDFIAFHADWRAGCE